MYNICTQCYNIITLLLYYYHDYHYIVITLSYDYCIITFIIITLLLHYHIITTVLSFVAQTPINHCIFCIKTTEQSRVFSGFWCFVHYMSVCPPYVIMSSPLHYHIITALLLWVLLHCYYLIILLLHYYYCHYIVASLLLHCYFIIAQCKVISQ